MAQKNNLEVQKVNTAVSQWTNSITNLVTKDFELCGVPYDDYSKQCAMSAMTSIYQLVKDSYLKFSSYYNVVVFIDPLQSLIPLLHEVFQVQPSCSLCFWHIQCDSRMFWSTHLIFHYRS